METVLFSVGIFAALIFLMSVGVIFSNKVIKGSCGGLGSLFGRSGCDACEKKVCKSKVVMDPRP